MLFLATLIASCEKDKGETVDSVEGTYKGTLAQINSVKNNDNSIVQTATAEITKTGERNITVYCYGEGFDTTIVLNYFHGNDTVPVCMTGDAFQNQYGHMYGGGHMGGDMMDDMHDGETEWMHHMSDEHDENDQHFGGFSNHFRSFEYNFQMNNSQGNYYLRFYGEKQ